MGAQPDDIVFAFWAIAVRSAVTFVSNAYSRLALTHFGQGNLLESSADNLAIQRLRKHRARIRHAGAHGESI
jgi:hypothetical protein